MNYFYAFLLVCGWAFLGNSFHWPTHIVLVAYLMTITFGHFVTALVAGDKQ